MNSLLYGSPHLLITYIDNKDEAIEYFKKHLEMEPLQSLVIGILFYKDADMIKLETSNHVFDTINAGTVPFIDKWKALFHPYRMKTTLLLLRILRYHFLMNHFQQMNLLKFHQKHLSFLIHRKYLYVIVIKFVIRSI